MKYRKLLAVLLIGNLAIGMTGCGGAGNIDATSVSAATTTQKDILDMLNTSDTITIEMSVEDTNEGYKYTVEWIRLGDMISSKDVRSTVDELFKITGSTGNKNGCFYTNEKGENTQNGTLALSMRNRAVTSILKDTEELNMNLATKYSDLEVGDANAVYTAIADYFELLPCDESGESKSDDALSRAEAMSMVFKAMNPVDDSISEDAGFNSAVGENSLNIFAAQEEGNCFINTSDGSLNSTTYTQHMTKAEFVYMVMNSVFGEAEVQKISGDFHLDGMDNAGNLKADEKISGKAQAGSAIIKEFITNPTSIDENIYKSIVLANSQKIISSTDDLDNAITKADAVKILCNALMLNPNIDEFNFSNGTSDDIIEGTGVTMPVEEIEEDLGNGGTQVNGAGLDGAGVSEDTLNNISIEEAASITDEEKESSDYKVEDIKEKKMYALADCYIRKGPSISYDTAGNLTKDEKVTVNGKVTYKDKVWYRLKTKDGTEKYVVASLLADVESTNANKDTKDDGSKKDTKDDSKKNTSSNNNSGSSNNSSGNSNSGSSNNSGSNDSGKKDKDKNSSSGSNKNTSSDSGKKDKDKDTKKDKNTNTSKKDKDKNNNNGGGGFDFDPNSSEVAPEDDYDTDNMEPSGLVWE